MFSKLDDVPMGTKRALYCAAQSQQFVSEYFQTIFCSKKTFFDKRLTIYRGFGPFGFT